MKKIYQYFIIVLSLVFTSDCFSQDQASEKWVRVVKVLPFDKVTRQYYSDETLFSDIKIWFKDSFAIQLIKIIRSESRNDTLISITADTLSFAFMNIHTGTIFYYQHFSDTAVAMEKIPGFEKVNLARNFWASTDERKYISSEFMADTLINNVPYKRVMTFVELTLPADRPKAIGRFVTYSNCDQKKNMMSLNKRISDITGCPVMMIEFLSEPGNETDKVEHRIEFLSDELTAKELNVFKAWETNAKSHSPK